MKTIIANWKMNPSALDEALGLFDFYLSEIIKYPNIKLVVCPPFVYLEELAKRLASKSINNIELGAQDLFWEKSGPYTGEVSVDMLKNFGVTYVLVGHSDRRYKIGETDEVINKKLRTALESGIVPVLLVGEKDRSENRRATIEAQLRADLAGFTADEPNRIFIAYEPVWAISTSPGAQPDSPANTLEALDTIKRVLITHNRVLTSDQTFLYGGSINEKNVAEFLRHPEISGAVIGGASLRENEFGSILKIAATL